MTSDPLADRVRAAVESFAVPDMSASAIATRVAAARIEATPRRRPVIAIAGGVALLAAALAVAVPTADQWMTPAYFATVKRLTGVDWTHVRSYEAPIMTLDEARRHTRFPIVAPRGRRVLNVVLLPKDEGAMLLLAVDHHAPASLGERWANAKRSKMSALDGVGIHADGTIRRFNVRRWRIGRIEYSLPMFSVEDHRYAEEVERATREASAAP